MANITLTSSQLELMIACLKQVAEEDASHLEELGEKRAGPHFTHVAKMEKHLAELFDVYTTNDGTSYIDRIEIAG